MANFVPGKYYLTPSESLALIAQAKTALFEDHPEFKPFENQIGSYIARAVETRNERGIARSGGDYREDESLQAKYLAELRSIAEKEARRCMRLFRDEADELLKQQAAMKPEGAGEVRFKDFGSLPLSW